MKSSFAISILLSVLVSCTSQPEADLLKRRFSGFVHSLSMRDTTSIKTFTYPKLLTIKSNNESRSVMFGPMSNLNEKVSFDSIRKDSIYPIIKTGDGLYSIATIVMRMTMISDSVVQRNGKKRDITLNNHAIGVDAYPTPKATLMATLIQNEFNIELLDYKELPGRIILKVRIATIAAKDKFAKEWSFVTVGNDQELLNELFSAVTLKKLSAFNKD